MSPGGLLVMQLLRPLQKQELGRELGSRGPYAASVGLLFTPEFESRGGRHGK